MALLDDIEAFLSRENMSATAFGAKALNDPPFVAQLRKGRDVKESTAERVRSWMREYKPEPEAEPDCVEAENAT